MENSAKLKTGLDSIIDALGKLPATKLKRTAELNSLTDDLNNLNDSWQSKLDAQIPPMPESETIEEVPVKNEVVKSKSKSFYEEFKAAQTETNS